MSGFKSDFLQTLKTRGFIHQISDESGLDEQSDEAGAAFGAYATAYIEVVGAEAARHVARNFVSKSSLSTNARTLAAQALALQGSVADAALSETIRQEVAAALKADPTLAPIIAHQFGQYEDWTHKVALWAAIRGSLTARQRRICCLPMPPQAPTH